MANKPLKTIKFPGLDDTYTIPQKTSDLTNDSGFLTSSDIDDTLTQSGKAADAKIVGDKIEELKNNSSSIVNSASGSIASFTDGAEDVPVKNLKFNIEPVQDLHGYDYPWPAGGGKNKLPLPQAGTKNGVTVAINTDGSITFSGTATSTNFFNVANGTFDTTALAGKKFIWGGSRISGIGFWITQNDGSSGLQFISSNDGGIIVDNGTDRYAAYRIDTGTDFGSGLTLSPMIIDVDATTTFEPYSNICPISGWTEIEGVRTGKNLLDKSTYSYLNNANIGWGGVGGTNIPNGSLVLKAGTYTFSASVNCNGIYVYDKSGTRIAVRYNVTALTFAVDEEQAMKIVVYIRDSSSENIYAVDYQLELGSTATDYEPYHVTQIPITLQQEAGTVYGGYVDVTEGKLVVDRANIASYAGETLPSTWISDRDVYAEGTTPTTGAQVVYQLAEPVEYDLTPQQVINSLLGENHIWCDSGETEVEYRADTKLYIDNKIAELQALILENGGN